VPSPIRVERDQQREKTVSRTSLPSRPALPWGALCLLLLIPSAASGQSWKQKIDQLWNDRSGQSVTEICQMHVVRAMPPLIRGSTSGHGCVVNAIAAARQGEKTLALGWLRAGYCGDRETRMRIDSAGPSAVDYAVRKFGPRVP
jgi:hypothetical protein